jgi:hypothetical protein
VRLQAAIVTGLALCGGAAQALDCTEAMPGWSDGVAGVESYDYEPIGAEFVLFQTSATSDGNTVIVLEHCPTRQAVVLSGDPDINYDASGIFFHMIYSPDPYSLGDMARAVEAEGEQADLRQGAADSCPCLLQADPATRKGNS